MHKKILKVILMLCVAFFCAASGGSAFAADGAIVPGNNPTAGGCRPSNLNYWTDWWDTCFGASWQKYKVTKDLPDWPGIYFYYTANTGNPIGIRGCKKGQYVYNYGLEVYNGGGSTGYQVSTQRNKDLPQAPHNSEAKGGYGGTVSEYLTPVGYVSAAEAEASYDRMVEYINTHPEFTYVGNLGFTWANVGAFCYTEEADGSEFQGKTEVTGAATNVAGYTNKNKTEFATVNNCSATEGCKVSFSHSLKRTSGSGSTSYTVSRSSNFIETGSSSKAIASNSKVKTGTFNSNEAQVSSSGEWTLYPGMVVCEKLEFSPNDRDATQKVYTRVCARALGKAETSLDIKVKNNTVEKFNSYSGEVYAKPDDDVTYQAKYSPVAQYTRRIRPETMKINNGTSITNSKPCAKVVPTSGLLGYCQLEVLYNGKKGNSLNNWNNGFTVFGEGRLSYTSDYKYSIGDETGKTETNDYSILMSNVGDELIEKADINKNDVVKTTPKSVSFAVGTGNNSTADVNVAASLDMNNIPDKMAKVYVPYNFINKTNILSTDKIVYAGEKVSVNYEIITDLRQNNVLGDTYATIVRDAEWKIETCYGDVYENCYDTEGGKGNLHENESIWENYTKNDGSTKTGVNIPDLPAGTKIRMRTAVYPKDSGFDTNLSKTYYDINSADSWEHSEWVEFVVAKKPSFQVWGGNVYSAGNIETLVSEKQHVANGDSDFNEIIKNKNNPTYAFGSWTELGMIASGVVKGLASGAGTGYASNEGGTLIANPGGSKEEDLNFCMRSTLSFANDDCDEGKTGFGKGGDNITNKEALVNRFTTSEEGVMVAEIGGDSLNYVSAVSGTNVYRKDIEGDLIITDNIVYSGGSYDDFENIPKTVIYVKGNILIRCNVTQIDAVLIAEGNINTCVNAENNTPSLNSAERSTPLTIRGSVIADTLSLNRTYGAATGNDSIRSAEIINYDSSLYLWARGKSDVLETGKIVTVYQRELSPRY